MEDIERIEFSEEQHNHWDSFMAQIHKLNGLHIALSFFEKRLGKVNVDVIEFRKTVRIEEEKHRILGDKNEELGISDILLHNLNHE